MRFETTVPLPASTRDLLEKIMEVGEIAAITFDGVTVRFDVPDEYELAQTVIGLQGELEDHEIDPIPRPTRVEPT